MMKSRRQSLIRFVKWGEIALLFLSVLLFFLALALPCLFVLETELFFWDLFADPVVTFLILFGCLGGLVVSVLSDQKSIGLFSTAIVLAGVTALLAVLVNKVFTPFSALEGEAYLLFGSIALLLFVLFGYLLAVTNVVRYFLQKPVAIRD